MRYTYTSFADRETEYDTLNTIHAPFCGMGRPTLSPEITAHFAREALAAGADGTDALKFFILADEDRWGFTVVPVLRREGQLQLGPDQFFRFETEGWVTNFFDGTK